MAMTIPIKPGQPVAVEGRLYQITRVIGFDAVLAKDQETGETRKLAIGELALPIEAAQDDEEDDAKRGDLSTISEEDWEIARKRLEIIKPLADKAGRTAADVGERAKLAEVDRSTVYRWLDAYESSGLLSSLLPPNRKGPGDKKLDEDIEKIIEDVIKEKFLKKRKISPMKVFKEVKDQCRAAKLKPPHYNTVRNRIQAIPKKVRRAARVGAREAGEMFDPIRGKYPDAKFPYAVFQIDHTQLPINIVDEENREPINKPWLTLAIDVNSRMVPGFYLSLDPPSAMAVGLCLVHAILPKEKWLAKRDIKTGWPIWGLMDVVHADNAKEFRGNMLKRALEEHHFDLYWRPAKTPNYGGHIESLLGTFMDDLRALPGAVGKDQEGRGDYRPEKEAAMTLKELERWLAVYIVEDYHQRFHSGINMSPIKKYELGIFGDDDIPGRGIPDRIVDEDALRIDFLPFVERTVQNYGVVIDHVHYYGHVLNRWINATDPENQKAKRYFIFRYDPRDMSMLYFYDPEIKDHFEVPYRDSSRPPLSQWEIRAAERWLKEKGVKDINEDLIFDAHERMRQIEDDAVRQTKHMRRNAQRRSDARSAEKPKVKTGGGTVTVLKTASVTANIQPFEEMEEIE